MEQVRFDCVEEIPREHKLDKDKYQKQKWRNAFQKYCDTEAWSDENQSNAWCKCGYMNYCDCCRGADMTNPCVKAICAYAKKNKQAIDYNDFDFEKLLERLGDEK